MDASAPVSVEAWARAQAILIEPAVIGPNGYVETIPVSIEQTWSQRALDTDVTAWAYERMRRTLMRFAGMADFRTEVAAISRSLQPGPGDVVLDLACGPGNFTVEWASLVGPTGLVIGIDYSTAMLDRAVGRVARSGLDNIVLVHADAQQLPLTDQSVDKVNCSGGFHAFPDLPKAIAEIARVTKPEGRLTASTFAQSPDDRWHQAKSWLNQRFGLHFIGLDRLENWLCDSSFHSFESTRPKGGFAYTNATKQPEQPDTVG